MAAAAAVLGSPRDLYQRASPTRPSSRRRRGLTHQLKARQSPPTPTPTPTQPVRYPPCNYEGNEVISCYPISNTTVYQNQWTRFIWNSNHPVLLQYRFVDVYLFHDDSGEQVRNWTEVNARQGFVNALVDDGWWDERGADWTPGTQQSYPYHFVVVPVNTTLAGDEPRQAVFQAIQTAAVESVVSASSVAAASSLHITSTIPRPSASNSPGLQNDANESTFPQWAIALLVVLGFLSLIAIVLLAYLLARNLRTRRRLHHRNSSGSDSPMMAAIAPTAHNRPASPQSPLHPPTTAHTSLQPSLPIPARSIVHHDGASTVSRAESTALISRDDANIAAEAFRKALRKPDFADRPPIEGESPDAPQKEEPDVMAKELAEEGRDIRSVSSERGVRVETTGDNPR